jgi:hypothetical protein
MVSSYAENNIGGASPGTAGALLGFMGLQFGLSLFGTRAGLRDVHFYGVALSWRAFVVLSAAAYGAWALAAAKWRIGRDLLEPRRFLRLPAFLTFLVFYQAGFTSGLVPHNLMLPAFFAYFAAVMNSERLEHWKKWLGQSGTAWWDGMPAWLEAAGTCALLAVAAAASGDALPSAAGVLSRYPLLQVSFLVRDLCFLQWCRFTSSRRPEIMALVYIALAYALPGFLLGAFKVHGAWHLFYPLPEDGVGAAANLAPALLQAAGAAAVLVLDIKARLQPR